MFDFDKGQSILTITDISCRLNMTPRAFYALRRRLQKDQEKYFPQPIPGCKKWTKISFQDWLERVSRADIHRQVGRPRGGKREGVRRKK